MEANCTETQLIKELVEALKECLQSLEYVQDAHGHHITGGFKRYDDMLRAKKVLAKIPGNA